MRGTSSNLGFCLAVSVAVGLMAVATAPAGDIDDDGYVGRVEIDAFAACFGGPDNPPSQECVDEFDSDADGDVDMVDFIALAQGLGHLPMPLKDILGNAITIDSTMPYSPRITCGECHQHEADAVANGEWFQQGRTDLDGNVDMYDDYFGDGRYWIKSAGRYGKWGQSFQFLLAAKDNTHPSQIDQTTFAWVQECSGCHAGGGAGEFDRDDQLIYNVATGEFGYELLGQTPEDVALDGDYSVQDRSTGTVSLAPWDVTGVSGPDCLLCHRGNRPTVDGVDMVFGWRGSVLTAGAGLTDDLGDPVPAYAAAATAGQGWFSNMTAAVARVQPPVGGLISLADAAFVGGDFDAARSPAITTLQIDYSVGVANGSLLVDGGDAVSLPPTSVTYPPKDKACASCHPFAVVAGMVWFDDRDIHYRKFNNLNDEDPHNDTPPDQSTVCAECHPGLLDHNAAKGNSQQLQYRNELDWVNFRSCRECHLTYFSDGSPNPDKHPDAPDVPGTLEIHMIGFFEGEAGPMRALSCQACHVPYALTAGLLFRDITIPGSIGWTSQYLSADPFDPSNPDKSKWYPALKWKVDSDGLERVFPTSVWVNIYFGDWDQNGTPGDLSDDIIAPIFTWRVASVVGSEPLPGTTDDDGDGRIEINRPEEILAYLNVLKNNDPNGVPVAANPVLVRGHRVWYEAEPGVIDNFEHEGTGIPITSSPYLWGLDHNVLAQENAWGAGDPPDSCNTCHIGGGASPVFERLILIDPHGPDGLPVYTTVREMTGLNPP